jgi:hypothetical protein
MAGTERAPKAAYYPESDHMGESMLQRLIAELLRPMLARFLAERGERAFVGADQFIYWVEGDSSQRVAPDVYVIFGEDPDALPRSWLLWQCEHRPSFVLEVVGRDVEKDYEDAPNEYKAMGIDELIVFDPEARPGHPRRVRWQQWRRVKKRGFVPVFRGDGDRVYSETLRCWIRLVGEGAHARLRIGVGPHGDELVLTDREREDKERQEKERERQEKERERQEKERAELERERAEQERERAEQERERERQEKERAELERERERQEKEREANARQALERELAQLREELRRRGG